MGNPNTTVVEPGNATPARPAAPRVTLQSIESNIVAEYSFTADKATPSIPHHESLSLLTIHILVMRNGFTILGTSACAAPENFDAVVGARIARMKALDKAFELEGYLLKEQLLHRVNDPT